MRNTIIPADRSVLTPRIQERLLCERPFARLRRRLSRDGSAMVAEPTAFEIGRLKSAGRLPVASSTETVISGFEPGFQLD